MADPKLDGIAQTVFAKRERLKRDFDMGVEQFALLKLTPRELRRKSSQFMLSSSFWIDLLIAGWLI